MTEHAQAPFKPLFARVLIKREVKEKTAGGIIIADAKRKARCEGIVVATGPTCDESVKIGDKVIFGKYAGMWLDENGIELDESAAKEKSGYFVCADEDIICVVS